MMGIDQEYIAYCFDEAVSTWGDFIVSELDKVEGKTDKEVSRKRHNRLLKLLDAPDEQRFRQVKRAPKK